MKQVSVSQKVSTQGDVVAYVTSGVNIGMGVYLQVEDNANGMITSLQVNRTMGDIVVWDGNNSRAIRRI